ncbi:MAG: hypothetical protein JWM19_4938 [Actinomycetia bacterium]|nr:hypothetical protein [Actinomycetes bacterium]
MSAGNLVNENLIGYTGDLADDMTAGSTGYVHDGSRWYDSATGAFTSQDASSYLSNPTNGNRYAYAADNPANYTDPTGACTFFGCISAINELNTAIFGRTCAANWAYLGLLAGVEVAAAPLSAGAYLAIGAALSVGLDAGATNEC